MKAIVNTAPGRLEMLERPLPEPGPGQARVRVLVCGICATDLEMIDGWDRTGFPTVPGHEWSGVVDAVGEGADASLVGRPCVAENVLSDGGEVGFEHPGGYGEYLLTEAANLQVLPDGFPAASAALIEPLAVSVRALRRARPEGEKSALILGDGPIGLLSVMLLKRVGVEDITLVGGRPNRLSLSMELGATSVLNYHDMTGDMDAALREGLGEAPPLAIEASGSSKALEAALGVAASGGKILVIGDYGPARADFPWNHLLHCELELIGSNASADAWPEAVRLATEEGLPLDRLITHRFVADQFERAVETVRNTREAIKVVHEWQA